MVQNVRQLRERVITLLEEVGSYAIHSRKEYSFNAVEEMTHEHFAKMGYPELVTDEVIANVRKLGDAVHSVQSAGIIKTVYIAVLNSAGVPWECEKTAVLRSVGEAGGLKEPDLVELVHGVPLTAPPFTLERSYQ